MRLLDALIPARRPESRYSWQQWMADALAAPGGYTTTYGKETAEPIDPTFADFTANGLFGNGIVAAVELVRFMVFSEARFLWQRMENSRPGVLFGTRDLALLETPWPGGSTSDLLKRMILHADLSGNSYTARDGDELVQLRPDWTEIALAPRIRDGRRIGWRKVGYLYYHGGPAMTSEPAVFLADEVAHFAPLPDPLAAYRGCAWLTPVVREIQADGLATKHKLKFFENAATPNLAVSLPQQMAPEVFDAFVARMDAQHKGTENAYRTLYTAGGADVTVVGQNMQQLDFKTTQGAGETRIANAGGIHPVVVGLSEGLAGSSLNAGNYQAAKRSTADRTFRPLWRDACTSLQTLFRPPGGSRLWCDTRDIAFLRDDEKDRAEIASMEAQGIRTLGDGGWEMESVKAAYGAGYDWSLLQHTGLVPVQLQPPGTTAPQP